MVKRVLVELNRPAQIDKLRKVKAALFIAVPTQGSNPAELASFLSANPQIANMKLADLNVFLQGLENQWQNLMRDRQASPFPRSFCAYETKPTYGTVIVSRVYAATYCDQNQFPVDENHLDIVKPVSRASTIYDWARARILETSILAQGPRLQFALWKTPYNYKSGLLIEGVEWKDQYREYDFMVKNTSKMEKVTDLRLQYLLPWPVIASRWTSQEGCEGLTLGNGQQESFKSGTKDQITALHEVWTNRIEISATSLFPEGVFRGKLVMSAEMGMNEDSWLTVVYRDKSEANKTSYYQKISVIDTVSGDIKIEPEPLRDSHRSRMMFRLKEPVMLPGKNKSVTDR